MRKSQTAKDFVTSFTAENHLNTHGLDLATEEVHGGACADCSHIIRFEVLNDFGQSVQTLLDGKNVLVMDGA